jgi:hypothetical protein
MTLRRRAATLEAIFRVDTPAQFLASWPPVDKMGNFRLDETLPLRTLTVKELDAWQGGAAPSPTSRPR